MMWMLLCRPVGTQSWSVSGMFDYDSLSETARKALRDMMNEYGENTTEMKLVLIQVTSMLTPDDIRLHDPLWRSKPARSEASR